MLQVDIMKELIEILQLFVFVRDFYAQNGFYPDNGPSDDQGFDDWCADICEQFINRQKK